MDIEGSASQPAEIAVVVSCGRRDVVAVFHALVGREPSSMSVDEWRNNQWAVRNCHGIGNSHPLSAEQALEDLNQFLVRHNPDVLFANDAGDIFEVLPAEWHSRVQDLRLWKWDTRPQHPSHIMALEAKMGLRAAPHELACNFSVNHCCYQPTFQNPPRTLNQANKRKDGAHCAFYDAYEVMVFHQMTR